MLAMAQSEEGIELKEAAIDADPWLLGVQNGVIELKTGNFRPARREDYITKQAGAVYDPGARCPEWLRFLGMAMEGNEDTISYLQRVSGYLLTGDVSEEALFLFYGDGGTENPLCGKYCAPCLAAMQFQPMQAFLWNARKAGALHRKSRGSRALGSCPSMRPKRAAQ